MAVSMTSNGLVMPATMSASGNANTLDDYEEGTFNPTYTASGLSMAGYNNQDGSYVKMGRMVTFQLQLASTGTHTGKSSSASLYISGLPFTSDNFTNHGRPPVSVGHTASWTTIFPGWAQVSDASTSMSLMYKSVASGSTLSIKSDNLTNGINQNECYISGSYFN